MGVKGRVASWGMGGWCWCGRLVRVLRSDAWQLLAPRRPLGEAMGTFSEDTRRYLAKRRGRGWGEYGRPMGRWVDLQRLAQDA